MLSSVCLELDFLWYSVSGLAITTLTYMFENHHMFLNLNFAMRDLEGLFSPEWKLTMALANQKLLKPMSWIHILRYRCNVCCIYTSSDRHVCSQQFCLCNVVTTSTFNFTATSRWCVMTVTEFLIALSIFTQWRWQCLLDFENIGAPIDSLFENRMTVFPVQWWTVVDSR
jgi:hypothetical protein